MNQTLLIDDGRIQREVILIGTTLVGRDPECEISHADPRLSRRHAEFRVTPDGVTLRDLGSRNGTHVNGQPIVEVLLAPGDTVQIAHLTIRLNDGSAAQTVQMAGGIRAAGRPAPSPAVAVQDDRTRVISQADRAAAQVTTAVGLPMSALDDRTRVRPPDVARVQQSRPAARLAPSAAALPARVADAGEVMIRERSGLPGAPAVPLDLSVFGLAGTRWGRHVLLQGLALAVLVLLLTATPLLAWEVRLYGGTILSSWPVLLPVVAAALGAGAAVASLIARTTASGLASQGK